MASQVMGENTNAGAKSLDVASHDKDGTAFGLRARAHLYAATDSAHNQPLQPRASRVRAALIPSR